MMKKYNETSQNLGTIKEGSTVDFTFTLKEKYAEGYPKIKSAIPSCGCTNISVSPIGSIRGTLKAGTIPNHLRGQGFYNPTKYIDVSFSDGTMERLTITAKVIKA